MSIGVAGIKATPITVTAKDVRADSPRDAASAPPPAAQPVTVDATGPGVSPDVQALQREMTATRSTELAGRRDGDSTDVKGVQIGVRARVATEGITNVGASGSAAGGSR